MGFNVSIVLKHGLPVLVATLFGFWSSTFVGLSGAHAQPAVSESATTVETDSADIFVSGLVDKLRIIAASEESDNSKTRDIRSVLSKDIATRRLQFFLLSRKQRSQLSKEEIAKYDAVFPKYITSAFAASIDNLVSREVKVNDVVERRPGDYIVRSKLYSDDGAERASLDWRVLESNGRKQLVDVMIDGLSFNVERRAQFTSILKADGFDSLLDHMNEIATEQATSTP